MRRRTWLSWAGAAALAGGAGSIGWRTSVGSMRDYEARARQLRSPLPADPGAAELIRYASLAANSHNTQPWTMRAGDDAIEILPDFSRTTPAVDPDNHHLWVSLGCAAENLSIAGNSAGRPGVFGANVDDGLRYDYGQAKPVPSPLFEAIPQRQCTRAAYDGTPLPPPDLETLGRAAQMPGVRSVFVTDDALKSRLRDLIVAGSEAQLADAAFVAELRHWLRFNPRSALASGDGLFSASTGNPVLPDALGRRAFDRFFTAAAENERVAKHIDSSSGLVVFLAEREDAAHWVLVGRACQRFALAATTLGLKHAFVNQPVEVASLRAELAALVGERGLRPDLVMRFGRGPLMPWSLRRTDHFVV